jgi:hypothetical protein
MFELIEISQGIKNFFLIYLKDLLEKGISNFLLLLEETILRKRISKYYFELFQILCNHNFKGNILQNHL